MSIELIDKYLRQQARVAVNAQVQAVVTPVRNLVQTIGIGDEKIEAGTVTSVLLQVRDIALRRLAEQQYPIELQKLIDEVNAKVGG